MSKQKILDSSGSDEAGPWKINSASQTTPKLTPILTNWIQNYANMPPVDGLRAGRGRDPEK